MSIRTRFEIETFVLGAHPTAARKAHALTQELMQAREQQHPDLQVLEEIYKDPLTKSKQRLATMRGIRDRDSVLQYLREPELMENVNKYLQSMRPQPSVQNRMMLEDKQMGRGKRSKKQGKKSSKKQGKKSSKKSSKKQGKKSSKKQGKQLSKT